MSQAQIASQLRNPASPVAIAIDGSANLYEMIVRRYLKPGLGSRTLTTLTVPMVQEFLNRRLRKGDSIRKGQVMRTVLSAALTRAVRKSLSCATLLAWSRAARSGHGLPTRHARS